MSNNNDRFDRLEEKIDRLDSRLDSVEKILAVNTQIVKEHERRSTTLEAHFVKELTPIKNHVTLITTGFRVITFLSVVAVGVLGVINVLRELGVI
jgi:hypothetical protein